jgi:dTDP-4-dehydrorhamnose 3,5-epimerase
MSTTYHAHGMETRATPTNLEGVVLIDVDFFRDERGFFIEFYHRQRFHDLGLKYEFVQDNHSRSSKGVLRGLHYQSEAAPMGKLVRCTTGLIFDVAVDIRMGSPTFGKWFGTELGAENMRQVMVPSGFAHGFVTLSDYAEVQYKCTGYYTPSAEGTLAWNDSQIAVEWPVAKPVLSVRDQKGVTLQQYAEQPAFRFAEEVEES